MAKEMPKYVQEFQKQMQEVDLDIVTVRRRINDRVNWLARHDEDGFLKVAAMLYSLKSEMHLSLTPKK